jgi:hypothetical protein
LEPWRLAKNVLCGQTYHILQLPHQALAILMVTLARTAEMRKKSSQGQLAIFKRRWLLILRVNPETQNQIVILYHSE